MEEDPKPFAISKKLLLAVYGIIPLVLGVVFFDITLFSAQIKETIGLTATTAAIYILLLELPHIMGSFISYADNEYIRFYKKKIFFKLPLLLIGVAVLFFFQPELTFALYIVYTMYHSLKQQTGIAGILVGKKSAMHTWWTYAAIIVAVIGNFYLFTPQLGMFAPYINLPVFTFSLLVFIALTLIYLRFLSFKTIGFQYVLATTLLLVGSYFCIVLGYLFFAVFLVRFVHDATAFVFYSVHDANRNAQKASNIFYMVPKMLRIPSLAVTPVLAVVIAHYLQVYVIGGAQSAVVIIFLGCAHYYIESFMWKHESLHRKQLRFIA
jgi:hypothetical protein